MKNTLTKKSGLVLAAVIGGVLGFSGAAQAVVVDFTSPTGFSGSSSPINGGSPPVVFTVTPGTSNNGSAGSTLNATATSNGFGGFFTAGDSSGGAFFSLGALQNQTISGSPSNATVTLSSPLPNSTTPIAINYIATSSSFANIAGTNTSITFKWAFRGTADGITAGQQDKFQVFTTFDTVNPIFSRIAGLGYGQGTETLNIAIPTAGSYGLIFQITEGDDPTANSAAGFNSVILETGVPFEFTPSLGIISVAGAWGGLTLMKKFRQKSLTKKGE